MWYNIRCSRPVDGENTWPRRREAVARLIDGHADLAGLQEPFIEQIDDLCTRTFPAGDAARPPTDKIDFVLVDPKWTVRRHAVLNEPLDGGYPSDHLPAVAELGFHTTQR